MKRQTAETKETRGRSRGKRHDSDIHRLGHGVRTTHRCEGERVGANDVHIEATAKPWRKNRILRLLEEIGRRIVVGDKEEVEEGGRDGVSGRASDRQRQAVEVIDPASIVDMDIEVPDGTIGGRDRRTILARGLIAVVNAVGVAVECRPLERCPIDCPKPELDSSARKGGVRGDQKVILVLTRADGPCRNGRGASEGAEADDHRDCQCGAETIRNLQHCLTLQN